jgi:hypothetical protein
VRAYAELYAGCPTELCPEGHTNDMYASRDPETLNVTTTKASIVGFFLKKATIVDFFVKKASIVGFFLKKASIVVFFLKKASIIDFFLKKTSTVDFA